MKAKILVIDDEPQIVRFLTISLTSQGYEVIEANTGAAGIAQAALANPDLVILDLGLPDIDGKHVLQQILATRKVPVLVLSVRASEHEKVLTLDMGAEDYVVKPFSVNELLARVRRILASRVQEHSTADQRFDDGQLFVDCDRLSIRLNNEPISLTKKEWAVLDMLLQSPGKLITQTHLLSAIWGPSHLHDSQYLRNVVRQLRLKLQDDAANPRYIETEPGIGYRFLGVTLSS